MAQDHAVQESMGLIPDRSIEQLATTDRGVIALRRAHPDQPWREATPLAPEFAMPSAGAGDREK